MEQLIGMIEEQQAGHENEPAFMIGEQLKDMARADERVRELLEQDLAVKEMSLKAAAGKLKEYADKHHGKEKCFCITPKVAEGILRQFYGLPEDQEETPAPVQAGAQKDHIELEDFLA